MNETERVARLPQNVRLMLGSGPTEGVERRLTAAGLTIVPIEPDEATVDEMARAAARALFDELGPVWAETNEREKFVSDSAPTLRAQVRAAWRAGVGRKEG